MGDILASHAGNRGSKPLRGATSYRQFSNSSAAESQAEDRDRAFAFDVELAQGLAVESRSDQVEGLLGGGDAPRRAHADHAGGDVDRVAPDVELIALLAYDAGDDGS